MFQTSGNLLLQTAGTLLTEPASKIQTVGTTTTHVGITLRGAASQTANLVEIQNSSSTVLSSIAADGTMFMNSGERVKRTATAIDYTILVTDYYVGVTSTAAPRTITLPTSTASLSGRKFIIKDESGGAATNNITITRAGSDTIDGATTFVINTNYGSVHLIADGGTAWFVA